MGLTAKRGSTECLLVALVSSCPGREPCAYTAAPARPEEGRTGAFVFAIC